MSTTQTLRQVLQHVSQQARRLAQAAGEPPVAVPQPLISTIHSKPKPSLPDPQPITVHLVALGLHPTTSERFSGAYLRQARSVKDIYIRLLHYCLDAWTQSDRGDGKDFSEAVRLVFQAQYLQDLQRLVETWLNRVEQQIASLRRDNSQRRTAECSQRPPFKLTVSPILEHAFSQDPYPTRKEKERLAQSTGIEYRQVHVWFQNRRSRSKRNGQDLRNANIFRPAHELPPSAGLQDKRCSVSIPAVEVSTSEALFSAALDTRTMGSFKSCSLLDNNMDERPAHAYPSPYPPLCHYDPFPLLRDTSCTFELPWPRRSSQKKAKTFMSPDAMDDLTRSFNQLSLTAVSRCPSASVVTAGTGYFDPRGFTETYQQVPSPALIRLPALSSHATQPQPRAFLGTEVEEASKFGRPSPCRTRAAMHPYTRRSRWLSPASRSMSPSSSCSSLSDLGAESSLDTPLSTPICDSADLPTSKAEAGCLSFFKGPLSPSIF